MASKSGVGGGRGKRPGRCSTHSAAVLVLILAASVVHYPLLSSPAGPDLRGMHAYSMLLAEGTSPYASMAARELTKVGIIPNYMPLVYSCGAAIALAGCPDLECWVFWFRSLTLVALLVGAWAAYAFAKGMGEPALGVFAAAFLLFNRFSLLVLREGHMDVLTTSILICSACLFAGRPRLSLLILGVSIAFKPFTLVVAPVYVILLGGRLGWAKALFYVAAVPVAVSLPFIAWHPVAFLKAFAYNFVRGTSPVSLAYSEGPFTDLFGAEGALSRLPMLLMFVLVYWLAYGGKVGVAGATLLAFSVFVSFSPYIYPRYFSWMMPYLVLAVAERIRKD
jgi:hypothetical protein